MNNGTIIVEEIIQHYPELMNKQQSLKDAVSRSSGSNSTSNASMIELSPEEQRQCRAIFSAIQHTAHTYHDGSRRLLVIQESYWGGVPQTMPY